MSAEHRPPERPHPALAGLAGPLPEQPGNLVVRQPTAEEDIAHRTAVDAAFGSPFQEGSSQQRRLDALVPAGNRRVALERIPGAGERVIGGRTRIDSALSLPGGGRVPVAALSGVGVDPGARHRGAFRDLLQEHLAECRERGDAASVLIASVSDLYPRFGYGCATHAAHWQIDAAAARLQENAPTSGRVHLEHARGAQLHAVLDEVWRAAGSARAGALDRSAAWWDLVMSPEESWLGGGRLLVAIHTRAGRPDGYALFTDNIDRGRQGLAEAEIEIKELVAADPPAELDLWRFISELPWARSIGWHYAPVDPVPGFWLADPRQLRQMAHFDFLWLRPLDMPALVAARFFAADGTVALAISDQLFPEMAGRFDLQVRDGVGAWVRGAGEASLQLTAADLGALWLGDGSARALLEVGRISGDPAAARDLDGMLSTGVPPRGLARF